MSYCTLSDLTARYGARMLVALSDRGDMPTGTPDLGVIGRALSDTDAVIDGYLAARYVLPLAAVPVLLTDIAQQIAIWKLHIAAPDPKIEADYKDALRALRDIAGGTIRLSLAGVEPAATSANGVMTTDRERPLTAENLKGFI